MRGSDARGQPVRDRRAARRRWSRGGPAHPHGHHRSRHPHRHLRRMDAHDRRLRSGDDRDVRLRHHLRRGVRRVALAHRRGADGAVRGPVSPRRRRLRGQWPVVVRVGHPARRLVHADRDRTGVRRRRPAGPTGRRPADRRGDRPRQLARVGPEGDGQLRLFAAGQVHPAGDGVEHAADPAPGRAALPDQDAPGDAGRVRPRRRASLARRDHRAGPGQDAPRDAQRGRGPAVLPPRPR